MPSCIYNKFMPIESIISNFFSENISLFGEVYSRLFLIPLPLTLLKKSRELSSFLIVFLKYIPFLQTSDKNFELFTIFWAPKAAATPKECPWYVLDGKRIEPNLSFILFKYFFVIIIDNGTYPEVRVFKSNKIWGYVIPID